MIQFKEPASCHESPDSFFTEDGQHGIAVYKDIALIERICAGCRAKPECLDYALKHDVMGYWANTTERKRRAMRLSLNIIPRPLYLDYN